MPLVDDDLLMRLRAALRDPTQRGIIQREIENSAGDGLGGTLSKLGGAMSAARSPGGAAATGLGGALGLGLGLFLKNRRNRNQITQGHASSNPVEAVTPQNYEPQGGMSQTPPVSPGATGTTGTGNWSGSTVVDVPKPWEKDPSFKPSPAATAPSTAPPPASPASPPPSADLTTAPSVGTGSRLMMGQDSKGNAVHSTDGGTTWITDKNQPAIGDIYFKTDIGGGMARGGRVRKFAAGGDLAPEPEKPPVKGVLVRKPVGMPIPVISTTIVLRHHPGDESDDKPDTKSDDKKVAKKKDKKPERKRKGGMLQPRRPGAVPPRKGPGNGPPAPYAKGGHVQVPKGSGCATKGKSFKGIF